MLHCLIICGATSSSARIPFFSLALAQLARIPWNGDDLFLIEWPTPSNKKEVQLFLGFINFYWRFIEGFLHITCALFDLTKADSAFKWSSEEKSAFDILRDRITSAPILALLDNSRPYRIEADSSDLLPELSYPRKTQMTESGIPLHSCLNLSEDTFTHRSLWWNMSILTFPTHSTSPTLHTSLHIDVKLHFPQIASSVLPSISTLKHRQKRTPSYPASKSESCHYCMYYHCVASLFYFPLFL